MDGSGSGGGAAGLADIARRADELGRPNFERTGLASIHGGGGGRSPELALVFMNPTRRNLSSRPGWSGPRFPFIGTSRVWRLLGDCRLLDGRSAEEFAKPAAAWSVNDACELEKRLKRASLYITNVVKETAVDSRPPAPAVFRRYESLLGEEMELVGPRLIVAFGLAACKSLTGASVRMSEIYESALSSGRLPIVGGCRGRPVVACYFPLGRGDPRRAAAMLEMVAERKIGLLPAELRPKRP